MVLHSETLLSRLLSLGEREWLEFKKNRADPQDIGEYISALANAAAFHGEDAGYLVWGVSDSREEVGTTFQPRATKKGAEPLQTWLAQRLNPRHYFNFSEVERSGKQFVILRVPAATHRPIRFGERGYIRVGSSKRRLLDHPEMERTLWDKFRNTSFEDDAASDAMPLEQALPLLDFPRHFELLDTPLPNGREEIAERLVSDRVLTAGESGYEVTNLGAILLAKRLDRFPYLERKAVRVVRYKGRDRLETVLERPGRRGYASGFDGLVEFVSSQLPQNEEIRNAIRVKVKMYPDVAIRELIANALIHQNLSVRGTGPMIEIFEDRLEITNPGVPLVDVARFVDQAPQSRNERLAFLMRRYGICEERGTGIDKVIAHAEIYQLAPPEFTTPGSHTKAALFGPRPFSKMTRVERLRACYQHACLLQVRNQPMTNATLRKRFAIGVANHAMASRLISDAVAEGLIKPQDPNSRSRRHARYVPYWVT